MKRFLWIFVSSISLYATDFIWDGGGGDDDWSTPMNWDLDSGFPDDASDKATFPAAITADVDISSNTTVGEIEFDTGNAFNASITSPGSSITPGTISVTIASTNNVYDFAIDVAVTSPLTFENSASGTEVEFSDKLTGSSTLTLNEGKLRFTGSGTSTYTGTMTVDGVTATAELERDMGAAFNGAGSVVVSSGSLDFLSNDDQIDHGTSLTLSGGSISLGGTTQKVGNFTFTSGLLTPGGGTLQLEDNGTVLTMSASTTITGNVEITNTTDPSLVVVTTPADTGMREISGDLSLGDLTREFDIQTTDSSVGLLISGVISGTMAAAGVEKTGPGVLEFTGMNTYAGGTTITEGSLAVSDDMNLGASTSITLAGGALQSGSFMISAKDYALTAASIIRTPIGFDLTIDGEISGAFGLTKEGPAMLTLTFANTSFSGTPVIKEGTVIISMDSNLGTSASVTLDGGELQSSAPFTSTKDYSVLSASAIRTVVPNDLVISGTLSGAGSISKSGGGVLTLSGANGGFTGGFTLSGGTLSLSTSPNAGSGTIVLDGGTLAPSASMTLANPFSCMSPSTISVSSGELILSGAITTLGPLSDITKDGAGTLNLTGSSPAFTEGILVMGGKVIAGTSTSLGTGGITLDLGTTLESGAAIALPNVITTFGSCTLSVPTGNDLTLNGAIMGFDPFAKTGGGELILNGMVDVGASTTDVDAGTMRVNSTYSCDGISVKSGSVLAGTGSITATSGVTIDAGATVAPGASIGTLTITGPLTLSSGSTLIAEIADDGSADLILVTGGTVTIVDGASLILDPEPGVFLPGTMFTVIDADAAIIGGFGSNVTFTEPGFLAMTETVGTDVIVTLLEIGGFVDLASLTTGNAQEVAFCLDTQNIFPGTDLDIVATALQSLTAFPSLLQNALDQMQPAIFGALNLIQEAQATLMQSTIFHRLKAWGNGTECCSLESERWNVWLKPVGEWIRQQNHGMNIGYYSNTYGGMLGFDYTFFKHLYLGAAAGYLHNDTNWKRSRGNAHSHNIYGGVYVAWQQKTFHFLASFIGGWNDYNAKRHIKFSNLNRKAYHSNHGHVLSAHFEGSFSIFVSEKVRAQPYGRVEYNYANQTSFREHNARSLNLKMKRKSTARFRTDLGLDLSRCYTIEQGQVIPNVYVSWVREFRFKNETIKAEFLSFDCPMRLKTHRPTRSIFAPGAGITGVFYNKRLSLAARWDGEFARRYSNQKALIEVTVTF